MNVRGGDFMASNIKIVVDERMGVDRTLRKFKRMCDSFGIVKEYRKRSEYKKPSVRSKEKMEAADKRRKKTVLKGTRTYRKV